MTRKERALEERKYKRARWKLFHGFVSEEADESDNDVNVQSEEDSFRDAYATSLPLDLIGQPYL